MLLEDVTLTSATEFYLSEPGQFDTATRRQSNHSQIGDGVKKQEPIIVAGTVRAMYYWSAGKDIYPAQIHERPTHWSLDFLGLHWGSFLGQQLWGG